ncbi:MAG TPA: GTP cyclohydrolase II [Verrucomicrobiae bacterium]|nr:GTP cyclohydrolase II [Verrucomicrobiae bacterium]
MPDHAPESTPLGAGVDKPTRRTLAAVDRAMAELRRGAPVLVGDGAAAALVLAAETGDGEDLARLFALLSGSPGGPQGRAPGPAESGEPESGEASGGKVFLALTAPRAVALGLMPASRITAGGPSVCVLPVDPAGEADLLRRLADPTASPAAPAVHRLPLASLASGNLAAYAEAALALAKQARLLPAVAIGLLPAAAGDGRAFAAAEDILAVSIGDIASYETLASRSLVAVSETQVPLAGAEATRIITFRPGDGGIEHLAIVIGEPEHGRPVLTRLHSACLTGDLLGSLRCDCGDQLQGAIAEIARQGSGLLLYLAQEGRGIGLVNKLRAYRLQDRGADTLEANLQLGFDADERIYLPAAEMLRRLGFESVRLMTNNPEKVTGLARLGIAVVERVPHVFPSNRHNEGYLETKATRFGHMF